MSGASKRWSPARRRERAAVTDAWRAIGRLAAATLAAATLAAASLTAATAPVQTIQDHVGEAGAHYDAERYAESVIAYGRAIDAGAEGPVVYYNAACSAALAGQTDLAFVRLSESIQHGWRDVGHLDRDPDLASLHDDPRWDDILDACGKAEAAFLASMELPELRTELLAMRRVDQEARGAGGVTPDPEAMQRVDAIHTERLREIVDEHGWPTRRLVGADGARAAWLLVQHADAHPDFQRACLERMRAIEPGQVNPTSIAYLTDRVLVNEGKPQIHGTQFWTVDGVMQPRPILEPAKVESLRAAAGMISMQAYHRRMTGTDWDPGE